MTGVIPGATMVELSGEDHFVSGDPDQILDAFEPFVTGAPVRSHHLALAAVVCVSGPDAGRVHSALVSAGGRMRDTEAGTPVVLFDGPATAVRAVQEALTGASCAAGLAIGEVEVDEGPVAGLGVEEAVALAAAAEPGELRVTSTAGVLMSSAPVELTSTGSADGSLRVDRPRVPGRRQSPGRGTPRHVVET
jgi:hypothetical protein